MANTPAKKDKTDVAVPDYIQQDGNRGNENVTTDDITLPRIDVLQALSPQIKKGKAEYIEGAEQGMLFNTLTGELFNGPVTFVPVYFRTRYLLWKDRDNGGGLRGICDTQEEANERLKELATGEKPEHDVEAVQTAEHLVLVIDGPEISEAIISMAKSKMKVSRKLNSLIRLAGGDRFSRQYTVTPVEDEGPKGEYWNLAVAFDEKHQFPSKDAYLYALNLYEQLSGGERDITTKYEVEEEY